MDRSSGNGKVTLVLGGTGKTGRRVVERLVARRNPVRIGSRTGGSRFDWDDPSTWESALRGVGSVYLAYAPDLAVPGASEAIRSFSRLAVSSGVRRLVLLSGRGEEEHAQACERAVQESGAEWTVLRCSWFSQNFSESFLRDSVMAGVMALPVGDIPEPFLDADDIADAAVAALTEDGHAGEIHELTGPGLLTFREAADEISKATGREILFIQMTPGDFALALERDGVPVEYVSLLTYLFATVLDGRNAHVTDGVRQILGREPRSFSEYARIAAAEGAWVP